MGVFAALQLTHLIPAYRLTEEYLLRFTEAVEFSNLLFAWLNSPNKMQSNITLRKVGSHLLQFNQEIRP